jgi:hypothetical protein
MTTVTKRYTPRRYRRANGKRRRGFGIDFKAGRNVPFIGGSSLRIGTRAVKKIARREIGRAEETKVQTHSLFGNAFKGSTLYTLCPLQLISQGSDAHQRVGRSIYLRHLTLKGCNYPALLSSGSYAPTTFRVMGLWLSKRYLNGGTAIKYNEGGVGSSDLFFSGGITGMTQALIDNRLDADVVFDRRFVINPIGATVSRCSPFTIDYPVFKKVTYEDASVPGYLTEKQFYVVVMADAPTVATGALVNCYQELNIVVTFKDA